jgi:hypothetical protein
VAMSPISSLAHFLALLVALLAVHLPEVAQVEARPVDTCAATTAETRMLMDELFSDFALDNFGESFANALADELRWTVTGSSPIAGKLVDPHV